MSLRMTWLRALVVVLLGATRAFPVSGTLDSNFGTGGKVVTAATQASSSGGANAVLALANTQNVVTTIIVGGEVGGNVGVALYDGGGTIMSAFGGENTGVKGIFAGNGGAAQAMALRAADHLLLVAGGADGFLSTVMDNTGQNTPPTRTTGIASQGLFWGYGLVLLPDDAYMMWGQGVAERCWLARYKNDPTLETTSTLDTTFGTSGGTVNNLGNCRAIVQDGTGFVVGAERGANGHHGFGVARLTAAGALDSTYGTNGIATAFED